MGIIGAGCSSDQYSQFNNKTRPGGSNATFPTMGVAYTGPQPGSVGLESGQNYFKGCKTRNLDLAIQRSIKVGGGREIELRADLFNALNVLVFNGRQTTLQLNSPTDLTVRNSQFLADGSIDPARVRPTNAGFGAVTGANALRSVQGQIRFSF